MLWLLPEVIVIAYILTKFVMDVRGVRCLMITIGCIILQVPLQMELLGLNAKQYGCNYLVYPMSGDGMVEGQLEEEGNFLVGQICGYNILRLGD